MARGSARRAAAVSDSGESEGEEYDGDLVTPAAPRGAKGGSADEGALRGEVAALLGSLGLPAGGASDGFDDRDFRPAPPKADKKRCARGVQRQSRAAAGGGCCGAARARGRVRRR